MLIQASELVAQPGRSGALVQTVAQMRDVLTDASGSEWTAWFAATGRPYGTFALTSRRESFAALLTGRCRWRCRRRGRRSLPPPTVCSPIRPLASIDLLWISIVRDDDGQVRALRDALAEHPGGAVASRCAHAFLAGRDHRFAESARQLLLAAELARADGIPLVDNDIGVVIALRATQLGEPERACRLLAASVGGQRSPGSLQLQRYVRALVRQGLGRDEIDRFRSEAQGEGPSRVVAAELERLRDEADSSSMR